MRHRPEDQHGERQYHPGEPSAQPPHDVEKRPNDALYDGLPAVTNRQWDAARSDDAFTCGSPGKAALEVSLANTRVVPARHAARTRKADMVAAVRNLPGIATTTRHMQIKRP